MYLFMLKRSTIYFSIMKNIDIKLQKTLFAKECQDDLAEIYYYTLLLSLHTNTYTEFEDCSCTMNVHYLLNIVKTKVYKYTWNKQYMTIS